VRLSASRGSYILKGSLPFFAEKCGILNLEKYNNLKALPGFIFFLKKPIFIENRSCRRCFALFLGGNKRMLSHNNDKTTDQ